MVTSDARREAVAHARAHYGLSERRACAVVGVSRRVVRYRSIRPDDAALRQRLRELAGERRRFGYRRLGYLLSREGMRPNHKKLLACIARRGCVSAAAAAASGRWACGRRWRCRMGRTSAGRSTSSPTAWSAGGGSASCAWSMTSRGSAWRWWRTRCCRMRGWRGS